MDINKYISSGILELFVAGSLTEKENREVYAMLLKHPEILTEIQQIEDAIIKLTAAANPINSKDLLIKIKEKLNLDATKVIDLKTQKSNWISYSGWAASVILAFGLTYSIIQNNKLNKEFETVKTEQIKLEKQIFNATTSLADAKELNAVLRDKNILAIPLAGQAKFENTYAKVYWQKDKNQVYIDAQGLPEPPKGMVYQVWSLKLNPLAPTSIGLLDNFINDENKVFALNNAISNGSQAFGITLEPAGGSKSPTMEQLYTLGVVQS